MNGQEPERRALQDLFHTLVAACHGFWYRDFDPPPRPSGDLGHPSPAGEPFQPAACSQQLKVLAQISRELAPRPVFFFRRRRLMSALKNPGFHARLRAKRGGWLNPLCRVSLSVGGAVQSQRPGAAFRARLPRKRGLA